MKRVRCGAPVATSGLSFPDLKNGPAAPIPIQPRSASPDNSAGFACPEPLYGIAVMSTLAWRLIHCRCTSGRLPGPQVAQLSVPGLRFACAIISLYVSNGALAFATTTLFVQARLMI